MKKNMNAKVDPTTAAHLRAVMGPQGLGYDAARAWLSRHVDLWFENLVDRSSPEVAAWKFLNKLAAAEAARSKTAALMSCNKAAEEHRRSKAHAAAEYERIAV